ncbi:CGNR zinc finger domain-containing protein [soil metagenome]
MDFGHYTAQGAALAVDLVNAFHADGMRARPGVVPAHAQWNATTADRLRDVAERLHRTFISDDDAQAVTTLNDLLSDLPITPRLSTHDGRPAHLHYAPDDTDAVVRLACNAAMAVTAIVSEHGVGRLSVCAAPSCGTAFVDTSRNGQRRFCSPACANRTHVAAHRQRATTEPT